MLPSSITADSIPSLACLTASLNKTTLTFADGLCGANLPRTSEFLTSPNCNFLPEPPLGSTRDLYLRRDARYGPDDFICWPQPYNANYPFLAAIVKEPTGGDWDSRLMWLTLSDNDVDFTDNGLTPKQGVIRNDIIEKVQSKVETQKARLRAFLESNKVNRNFLDETVTTLDVCLTRISTTPCSLRDLQRGLSEVQRSWHVIKAVIDYNTQIERFQGHRPSVDTSRMGCFVWNDRDAMMMFNMGYPVFFIRPWTSFSRQVVLKVVSLTRPVPPAVETAPADPPYPPILTSQAGSDAKFGAIRKASIECFSAPSPFENMHLPGAYSSSYVVGQGRIYAPTASPASGSSCSTAPLNLVNARPQRLSVPRNQKRDRVKKPAMNRKCGIVDPKTAH